MQLLTCQYSMETLYVLVCHVVTFGIVLQANCYLKQGKYQAAESIFKKVSDC